jgi:hypothetical protein
MRNFLKTIIFVLLAQFSFAQLAVRVYHYRPTGMYGYVMKPTFSAEIGYMNSFEKDKRLRTCASASFLIMRPRLKSFPTYTVMSGGNGTRILPGEQTFKAYNILQVFGGADLAFIKKEPFYAYVGLDVTLGLATVNYTDDVETLKEETYFGGGVLGGFRGRLGVEYDFTDKLSMYVSAQRGMWLLLEPTALNSANDYGVGVKLQFN